MENKKNVRFSLILFTLCSFFFAVTANEVSAESSKGLNFSYENVIPKNQISDNSYFELKVKPGDKQTLVTKLTNESDKEVVVQVSVSNATTSSSGIINYGANKEKLVGKNNLSINDMIEFPTQVKLKAHETKDLKFKLNIPKKEFEGLILGGIELKELEKSDDKKAETGASLKNEYSYVYSVSLKENEEVVTPEFTSSGTDYEQGAFTTINNEKSLIASKVKIETTLMGKETDKVINTFKVEDYRFAPNSTLVLPLNGTEELPIGDYRTKTTLTMNDQNWTFEGAFKVSKENQKKKDVFIDETPEEKKVNWLIIVLVVTSFIGLTVGIFYLLNRKKRD
ncbi:DUF916 domain-containing protein [Vagococcus hydrophili]|uniref:DUF916 domain-containing protein n=1 Tax=Vagococcus hydrophili TaxID=2714947 RepID=A0A6G8ATB7_9ENTE|nr:DUF916 domain-containing protein [Vagococcus hydrophili]QIL48220.1 DUF916 domain-containing protein [Vagococcus hydrophili]